MWKDWRLWSRATRQKGTKGPARIIHGSICKGTNHWASSCKDKGKGATEKGNVAVVLDVFASYNLDDVNHVVVATEENANAVRHDNRWMFDSGASRHMTGDITVLSNVKEQVHPIGMTTANGNVVIARHEGTAVLTIHTGKRVAINKVPHTDTLAFSLLSAYQLVQLGASVKFAEGLASVEKEGETVVRATGGGKAFYVGAKGTHRMSVNFSIDHAMPAKVTGRDLSTGKQWQRILTLGTAGLHTFPKATFKRFYPLLPTAVGSSVRTHTA
jgi:hypothetical protein